MKFRVSAHWLPYLWVFTIGPLANYHCMIKKERLFVCLSGFIVLNTSPYVASDETRSQPPTTKWQIDVGGRVRF